MDYKDITYDCDWKRVGDWIVSTGYVIETDIDNLISKVVLFAEDDIPEDELWGTEGHMINTELIANYVELNGGLAEFDYE